MDGLEKRVFPPRFLVTAEDHEMWQLSHEKLLSCLEPVQEYLYRRSQENPENAEIRRLALEVTFACASLVGVVVALFGKFRLSGAKPYWLRRSWGNALLEVADRLEFPEEIVRRCGELAVLEERIAEYVLTHYQV